MALKKGEGTTITIPHFSATRSSSSNSVNTMTALRVVNHFGNHGKPSFYQSASAGLVDNLETGFKTLLQHICIEKNRLVAVSVTGLEPELRVALRTKIIYLFQEKTSALILRQELSPSREVDCYEKYVRLIP